MAGEGKKQWVPKFLRVKAIQRICEKTENGLRRSFSTEGFKGDKRRLEWAPTESGFPGEFVI